MEKNKGLYLVTALIVVVFAAWVWGWIDTGQYSDDPAVAELEKLRDASLDDRETVTPEQREAMRTGIEGLNPEQRMAFFESSMPIFVPMAAKRFEQEYDSFIKLSPEEQRKKLDERIDQMEKRGGPRAGPPPAIDPKKASEIMKKMLDWTTPEQRAKFDNGMQMMNQRRSERGLPPVPPMGGF